MSDDLQTFNNLMKNNVVAWFAAVENLLHFVEYK